MINFYQGNSVDLNLTVFDGTTNAAFDITNDKIWFTIKTSYSDPDSAALIQVTTESGITFVNSTGGTAVVSLLPTATENLPTNVVLYCDVQIRTPAGKVYTVVVDNVLVYEKVTDSLNYT